MHNYDNTTTESFLAGRTLDQLSEELRAYEGLRYPQETAGQKALGWYSAIAFYLAIGVLIGCFIRGVDLAAGILLAACAPGCWRLYQQEQRQKRYDRQIELIRAERARR